MEDDIYVETYQLYRNKLKEANWFAKPVPYDWLKLPSEISIEWFAYSQMAKDHAREIANAVNQLLRDTVKLSIWADIISKRNDEEKIYLVTEFIGHICSITLNLPYAIRSRFIFSVAHLCHQANRIKDTNWHDDLPIDKSINFKTMHKVSKAWGSYAKFEQSLTDLSCEKFTRETADFRNKFHHQIPVSIEIGLSSLISRTKDKNGAVSYGLGGIKPLSLDKIVPLLVEQHAASLICFNNYRKLINDQIKNILT